MSKPAHLTFGVNDSPPWFTTVILGLQHAILMLIGLVFPLLIINAAHGTAKDIMHVIQAVMLVMGITTILLSMTRRFLGAGYFVCGIFDPAYLSVSLAAAKLGGLPLLYTINYIQSLLQMLFAGFIIRLRKFFPTEISGLVIFMIGISIIGIGITNAIGGVDQLEHLRWDSHSCIISSISLAVMIFVTVWGGKALAHYGLLAGVAVGLLLSWWLGVFAQSPTTLPATHWFSLPHIVGLHFQKFNWDLLVPMIVAVISVTLKAMGNLVTEQKINNADWKQIEMKKIRSGLLTTSYGSFLSSILGGLPMGISSSNVGLSVTTQATSRKIAYPVGIIYIVLSFIPAVSSIFVLLPKALMGAMLIFVIASIIVAGVQVMLARMIDARKMFVIGLPIIIGLAFEFVPQLQHDLPASLQPIVASPLTSSTVLAIVLNFLFQIGIAKHDSLVVDLKQDATGKINQRLHQLGGAWGALPETIYRATKAFDDLLHALQLKNLSDNQITINVSYDEYKLTGQLTYQGDPLPLDETNIDLTNKSKDNKSLISLAVYTARTHVDTLNQSSTHQQQVVSFIVNQ